MRLSHAVCAVLVVIACSAPTTDPDDGGTAGGGEAGGGEAGGTAGGEEQDAGTGGGTAGGSAGGSAGGTAGGGTAGGAGGSTTLDAGPFIDGGLRPTFFGTSRCAGSGLQLCEDFENGLDAGTWTQTGSAGISIGTTEAARGTHALHIQRTGNGSTYIRTTRPFPATNNTYWGRAFFKFIAMPGPPMTYSHWTIIAATGTTVSGEIRIGGQFTGGRNLWGVGTDNRTQDAGTGDWTNSDRDPNNMPRAVPLGEWVCLEWLHDGQNDVTRFFWNEAEHPSLRTTTSMHGGNSNPYVLPNFTAVWLGWAEYQASTLPFELWLDEVAIDPARIGCTR